MQNETIINLRLIAIQWLSYDGFPAFPWLLGFLAFHINAKVILAKRKFSLGSPRFKPITMPMSNQCTTIQPIHVS